MELTLSISLTLLFPLLFFSLQLQSDEEPREARRMPNSHVRFDCSLLTQVI
jgi:hypothetical protein